MFQGYIDFHIIKKAQRMSYYRFPLSLEGFRVVQSARQFETRLAQAAKSSGFSNILYIQVTTKNPQGHLYFRCIFCRDCKWSMKYEKTKKQIGIGPQIEFEPNSPYQLARFNIYHYHTNYRLQDILDKGRRLEKVSEKDGNEELIMSLAQMQYSHNQTCGYVSYLTGLSFLTARFIFYTCQTRRLVADFDDDFHQWYQTYKQKNLQILTFPPVKNIFYLPDIIFITCQSTMDLYQQKGHITAIKIIDNKVKQLSTSFEKYVCIAFYGYLGNQLHVLFGFAILTLGKCMDVDVDMTGLEIWKGQPVDKNKDEKKDQEGQKQQGSQQRKEDKTDFLKKPMREETGSKRSVKIYSNLYKILEVFLEVMGTTMQTILVEDKERIIYAVQHFITIQNQKRPKNNQMSLIIDPMDTIHRIMPKHMRSLLISLIRSETEQQWQRKYQQRIIDNNQLSMQDIEVAKKFYLNKHRFMMFNHKQPKFLGRWFDHLHHFSYQYIDSRASCKRSILFLLVYVSNSFVFLKKMYDRKFVSMIEHMTVEGILEFQVLKQVRLGMYKDGFRLLCQQVFKADRINCVSSEASKKQNKQIIAKLDQMEQKQQLQLNIPQFSISGLNSDLKNLSQFSACISQMQKPLSDYYKEMIKYDPIAIAEKNEKMQKQKQLKAEQNEQKKEDEFDSQQKIDQKREQQNRAPISTPSKPLVNIFFAKYEQLYPLRPPTTINLKDPPPSHCMYLDNNKYYTCQLVTTTPNVIYKCTCNYLIFRGLPCRHIVKTCLLYGFPIGIYISEYWKLKKPYNQWKEEYWICKGLELPKRGRPKKSARNRMRNR